MVRNLPRTARACADLLARTLPVDPGAARLDRVRCRLPWPKGPEDAAQGVGGGRTLQLGRGPVPRARTSAGT
jgi:hypothetical protein